MKILWQWLLVIILYALLYTGATDLWPMLAHVHHNDHQLSTGIHFALNGVVIPFGISCLIAAWSRRELVGNAWPLLLAPLLLHATTGYVTDSFYPPYFSEFFSLVASGAIQGVCALLGWFVYRRFEHRTKSVGDKPPTVSAS